MRKTVLFVFLLISAKAYALEIELEPDWVARYEAIKAEEVAAFTQPKVGDQITLVRRVGGELSGRISAITPDSVTVGGRTFTASQITQESASEIFAEPTVSERARERVVEERNAYNERKQARLSQEQARLRQERARVAEEERFKEKAAAHAKLNEGVERRRAAERERVAEQQAVQETARTVALGVTVALIFGGILGLILYFVPSIIAFKRAHHNAGAIFALNILLGWTFLGWVAALVWSLTQSVTNMNLQLQQGPSAGVPRSNGQVRRQLPRS